MTAAALVQAAAGVGSGWLFWPLLEYAIHGGLSHRWRTFASPLHWQHHRDPRAVFTSPLVWVPGTVALGAIALFALGAVAGTAFTAGTLAGFLHYEYVHWRFHFRAPRGAREERLRAHHLAHHYRNPAAYHGVTTRFWDRALGTLPVESESDYAKVVDRPPLTGRSNLGRLLPRRAASEESTT